MGLTPKRNPMNAKEARILSRKAIDRNEASIEYEYRNIIEYITDGIEKTATNGGTMESFRLSVYREEKGLNFYISRYSLTKIKIFEKIQNHFKSLGFVVSFSGYDGDDLIKISWD
jgi:hypothetical protein